MSDITEWFKPTDKLPETGYRFVAIHTDGSGAFLGFRHDSGYFDQEGDEFERLDCSRWTYLPQGELLWIEGNSEDSYDLPPQPPIEAADHIAALEAECKRLREALRPLEAAHARLRSYSETRPDDSARLYVEEDDALYELLNGEYGRPLVFGDLAAREALKDQSGGRG